MLTGFNAPMLQDPDKKHEEWEEVVFAPNLDTARSKCECLASELELTEVVNVTQAIKKEGKQGTYKYICWFRSEVK